MTLHPTAISSITGVEHSDLSDGPARWSISVAPAGFAVGWGWRSRKVGWQKLGAGPIGIAVVGAAVTLRSAPLDEWWHAAFGRDAVLWSPPHLVALVGTVALGSGVALVAAQSLAGGGRLDAVLLVATCTGVVGAWQVLVIEYDTDVAQFSPLWYLPVLAVAVAISSANVTDGSKPPLEDCTK